MARKLSPFQDQPPLLLGGSLFLLLQGISTGAEDFRVKESRFVFFSPAAWGEAEAGTDSGFADGLGAEDGFRAPGEAAAAALQGLPEARSGAAASWDTAAGSEVVTMRYCSSLGEVAGVSCSRDLVRPGEEARTAGARETWGSSLGGLSSTSGQVIFQRPHGSPGWPRLLARGLPADSRPGLESDF